MMPIRKSLIALCLVSVPAFFGAAFAASFECGKAQKPLEKLICQNPKLNAADTRMGEVYKQVKSIFPLKGFIPATQRLFVSNYASCMNDDNGNSSSNAAAVERCVKMVQDRINELELQALARVYSNAPTDFSHEELAILVYNPKGKKSTIRLWGNWLPDAYNPKPFPDGKICDIEDELKPVKDGYTTEFTNDSVFTISDGKVRISKYIMCTPRTSINEGIYRRVR